MPIVSHSVARGSVLGVQRLLETVDNTATGNVYIPIVGKFRIVAMSIVPLRDQSAATASCRLYAPDGTTALTASVDLSDVAGVQTTVQGTAPDNNLVDCETQPLVLTVTNAGAATLKFQVLILYSTSLSSDAGQYVDYIPAINSTPVF